MCALKKGRGLMRAYIHGFDGRAFNSDCQAAQDGFEKLGIETVLFTSPQMKFSTRGSRKTSSVARSSSGTP